MTCSSSLKNSGTPLVAHVIQRLAIGGLENGLVNLINQMPEDRYRHIVICLADATDHMRRMLRKDVPVIPLNQRPGHDFTVHRRLLALLRRLRPTIVHTRNLAALEFQAVAALAGVRGRVHGEHGRDVHDLDGENRKYNLLRKAIRPCVQRYTAVSVDLARWLVERIGIKPERVTQIYNGVDAEKFGNRQSLRAPIGPAGFSDSSCFLIGTVGRMEPVKDQLTLVRAFLLLLEQNPAWRERLRLVMVGDGPLRCVALKIVREARAERLVWLPGERSDVPQIMKGLDLFVLPSLREGVSNTILEAMASGLPVVATDVGGNPELVEKGKTGTLVPHSDPASMAAAIASYIADTKKALAHGAAGRERVELKFTMKAMVARYTAVYDSLLACNSHRETDSHALSDAYPQA